MTSSPKYQQSNGAAEAAVKIIKNIIKKCEDLNEGLLAYRTTPLENGYSPSELMFSRKIRSILPMWPDSLGSFKHHKEVIKLEEKRKDKQSIYYNKRHRTGNLSELDRNDTCWIIELRVYGRIVKRLNTPNSYLIRTERGSLIKRNRWHLVHAPHKRDDLVIQDDIAPVDIDVRDENAPVRNDDAVNDNHNNGNAHIPVDVNEHQENRPRRNCGPPAFYGDIVTH